MERRNIINGTLVVLEILFSTGLFYLLKHLIIVADFPFTQLVLFILTLCLYVYLNRKLTKENFNYPNSIIFLIVGIFLSYMTINVVDRMALMNGMESDFFLILICYTIPLILFNIGLRMKNKRTMPNNV